MLVFFNDYTFQWCSRGGGGGGTWRWRGLTAGQGIYDFAVINIGTGYLNRPNWLYWRATPFITGLLPRLPSRVPSPQCLWQAHDLGTSDLACGTQQICYESVHYQYRVCIMKVFSKVYFDRVYFLCAEWFETGSGFHPPPPMRVECPLPPGGGGGSKTCSYNTEDWKSTPSGVTVIMIGVTSFSKIVVESTPK